MKQFAQMFARVFAAGPEDPEMARIRQIHREWDLQRRAARTPAEAAEIDAIFARNL